MDDGDRTKRDLHRYRERYSSLEFERIQEAFRRKKLLGIMLGHDGDRAIEVGCGEKSIFFDWLPKEYAVVVEPIREMAEIGLQGLEFQSGMTLEFVNGFFEDFNSNDGRLFDTVILSSVLHEMNDPNVVLRKAFTLLRPGGAVFIVVTNQNSIHRLIGLSMGLLADLNERTQTEIEMQQTSAYTVESIQGLAVSAGFEIEHISTGFPKLLTHKQMKAALELSVIDLKFLNQIYDLGEFLPSNGSEIFVKAVRRSA